MELINDRQRAIATLIDWAIKALPLQVDVAIERKEIAEKSGVALHYTNKIILMCVNHGYMEHVQHRGKPSVHKVIKDLSDLSPVTVEGWIKDYQAECDQKARDKREESATLESSSNAQTGSLFEPLRSSQSTAEQPTESVATAAKETQPVPVKSRSEQLREEAQRLQVLAEEEAQREAQEAEQATEQPGTLPELLDLLDTRIDGIEHKFNALEKKVNVVLYFFQQASFAVRSLGPVSLPAEPIDTPQPEPVVETPPPAEPTTRALLVRLVNSYAAADRKTERDTWKWLYGQYDLRKGFNVYAQAGPQAKGSDESYLAVIEQHGHIDDLYRMARKLMVLPDLR